MMSASRFSPVTIRSHVPGDIGYVIHRHGVLYAQEYDFNHEFDAYVARGMAEFIEGITPREHLWMAESQGKFAGSIAIVRRDGAKAQLRWLIVEPSARNQGVGKKLVNQAISFAREQGYEELFLWTIDFLKPARHLYARAGFSMGETKKSRVWGRILTEERWAIDLRS